MYFRKFVAFVVFAVMSCFSFSTAFADYAVGDRGQEVIEIQKQLAVLHYNVGTVDGVFGPATEKAVKEFQTAKGLKVDGIVNDVTYRNLLNKDLPPDRYGNHMTTRSILKTAYSMLGVPYMFKQVFPCRVWQILSMTQWFIFPEETCRQAIWYFSRPIVPDLHMWVFMLAMVNLSTLPAAKAFLLRKCLPVTGVQDI